MIVTLKCIVNDIINSLIFGIFEKLLEELEDQNWGKAAVSVDLLLPYRV